MAWFTIFAAGASRWLWRRWDRLTAAPRRTQESYLLELVGRNRDTAFGKDHGFNAIRSIAEYRRQVPIADYERHRPYVARIGKDSEPILTAERTIMFNMTSGTTGEAKLLPVTPTTRAIHGRLTRLWYSRAWLDHPACFNGKVLGMVGSPVEGRTANGIPFGSASGLIYRSSPWWIRRTLALPYEIAEIKDFQAKYYTAMRFALAQDISFFATPNPSTILRMVETAASAAHHIVKDIHDGTISGSGAIDPTARDRLATSVERSPQRARFLEQLLTRHGELRPEHYWPNLKLIGCWKGGTVGVRLQEFPRWFGTHTPVRDLGYLASEAHLSLPISDKGAAGILAIDANYYEFIPEADMANANPSVLCADELERDGVYYIVVTTAGGLYRYDMNDLVRVVDFYRQTPVIEFLRKGRDVTSITGEKLHVNQLIQAVDAAQRECGISLRHYRAFADIDRSRYALLIELAAIEHNRDTLSKLAGRIDENLCHGNLEYAQKRLSLRLRALVLVVMKSGWFERATAAAIHSGKRDTQYKPLLLSHTPPEAEDVEFYLKDE